MTARTRLDDVTDVLRVIVGTMPEDKRLADAGVFAVYAAVEHTLDALDRIGRLRPVTPGFAYTIAHPDPNGPVVTVPGTEPEAAHNCQADADALDALLDFVEWSMTTGTPPHDLARKADDALRRLRPSASPQREAPGLRAAEATVDPDVDAPPLDLVRYPEQIARVRYDLVERLLWHCAYVTGRPRAVAIAAMTRPPG